MTAATTLAATIAADFLHERVESAELGFQRRGDVGEVRALGLGEVQRQYHRLAAAGGDDLVVERFDPLEMSRMQHDGGSPDRQGAGDRRTESAGGPGNQHHSSIEVGEFGSVGSWQWHVGNGGDRSGGARARG